MLVWVDIETTGINPRDHDILELAMVITDDDLEVVGQAAWVRQYHREWVADRGVEEVVVRMHEESGLWKLCEESRLSLRMIESEAIEFLEHMGIEPKTAPMAGSSIGSLDRPFVQVQMPKLGEEALSYRNVDVSTIYELAQRWYPGMEFPERTKHHRALADCHESISFLKFFRREVFR